VHNDLDKALDEIAEEQRTLGKGLEAEVKEDLEKAKGSNAAQEPPVDDEGDE
jgi:DNA-binding ferritin-like protein